MGRFIHQSVSCVITTNKHILLLKRSNELRHFPGYWSLPGGKIEKHDSGQLVALKREVYEELGAEFKFDLGSFVYLGKCLTPEFAPYRFENYVYHLHYDQDTELTPKINSEHQEFKWIEHEKLNSFLQKKDFLSVPMLTFFLNKALENQKSDFQNSYIDEAQEILIANYLPGIKTYVIPSRSLPPAKHTNALVVENWLFDPAPREEKYLRVLIEQWKKDRIDSIFISHWHLDHHENINEIAKELEAKVYLSNETKKRIEQQWGIDYFKDLGLEIIQAGDTLVCFSKKRMNVVNHNGHAQGQLGIEDQDGVWCFVSDVFQGVGSVVVEDMFSYMECLEELISKPSETVFIPSHGLPVRGSQVLQNIYNHRLEREEQIKKLLNVTANKMEILSTLYPNLQKSLHKYALKNIEGHIERIRSFKKS